MKLNSAWTLLSLASVASWCFRSSTRFEVTQSTPKEEGGGVHDAGAPGAFHKGAPKEGEPNCKGFGGMIHGQSECFRYDPAVNKLTPVSYRTGSSHLSGTLACDAAKVLRVGSHEMRLECVTIQDPNNVLNKNVTITLVIDDRAITPAFPGRRAPLTTHTGFWDDINVWVLDENGQVDLTIDYITYD